MKAYYYSIDRDGIVTFGVGRIVPEGATTYSDQAAYAVALDAHQTMVLAAEAERAA